MRVWWREQNILFSWKLFNTLHMKSREMMIVNIRTENVVTQVLIIINISSYKAPQCLKLWNLISKITYLSLERGWRMQQLIVIYEISSLTVLLTLYDYDQKRVWQVLIIISSSYHSPESPNSRLNPFIRKLLTQAESAANNVLCLNYTSHMITQTITNFWLRQQP